jgi:prepilin peptidase CpaA
MDWTSLLDHWEIKFIAVTLIVAAWIDGKELRVPNWITFPMVLSGLLYHTCATGWGGAESGFVGAFYGMCMGLICLLPLYAVGGMGAGDVKLMAGMGAWLASYVQTWEAFVVSVVVGALMAIGMVIKSGKFAHHKANFMMILGEWMTIRDPRELSKIAANRKPTMHLLPYGIPICIGSIGYFLYEGMML